MADIIQIQELCLSLPGVEECFPFDETTLVFKVSGKMFALIPLEKDPQMMVKCDPDLAEEWRLRFEEVEPAFHMNKKLLSCSTRATQATSLHTHPIGFPRRLCPPSALAYYPPPHP